MTGRYPGFFLSFLFKNNFEKFCGGKCIASRAVPPVDRNTQFAADFAERIGPVPWKKLTPQANRAHGFPLIIVAQPAKFLLNKPVIKPYIVRDKYPVLGDLNNPAGNLIKLRGLFYHFIVDAGKAGDKPGNITFRVYKARKRIGNLKSVVNKNSYLGDLPIGCRLPSSFDVDYCVQNKILKRM